MVNITKYGQSIIVAMMGVFMVSMSTGIITSAIGGLFIGSALKLARKSGEENC